MGSARIDQKYSKIGIWLCQHQAKSANRSQLATRSARKSKPSVQPLSFEESLWLQLINSTVGIAKSLSRPRLATREHDSAARGECDDVAAAMRMTVQNVFTALLQATTASRELSGRRNEFSFLQILRAFLTQAAASSPSLAELRGVIGYIFSAYAYEESLLALSNSMLDKDLFVHVDEIAQLRRRGWRPRGQVCEICRRRVWGPGAGSHVWAAWVKRGEGEQALRQRPEHVATDERFGGSTGKGKEAAAADGPAPSPPSDVAQPEGRPTEGRLGPALVFACRHLFHQGCFDGRGVTSGTTPETDRRTAPLQSHEGVERVCPICGPNA